MISMLNNLRAGVNEFALIAGMVGILLILFTPIPPSVLDVLLLLNFSAALLILLVTFYTEKPLTFSTFPSLLLMTTLFRLALNISATRLILDDARAGKVIDAVGHQVVGGNYIIGLVVFLILIVVQFVVVTNGAQRVAEVAARFILDSLPGKQMSIDADLNMGIIDQEEAKARRDELEKESNFYGAMDGASKFVKGDAIAGIIIILIDIIGGLTIGIAQKGMDWGDALHIYTLLTVGDGIVTQIPSLIIAVSAGIIITRAATDTRLAQEITSQFSAHPKTLVIVNLALLGLALVPGIPVLPILCICAGLCLLAWFAHKKNQALPNSETKDKKQTEEEANVYEELKPEALEITLGSALSEEYLSASSEFEKRISVIKKHFGSQFGVILPPLSVKKDKTLDDNAYALSMFGVEVAGGSIQPEKILAIATGNQKVEIEGEPTREPTYGLDALWINADQRSLAHTSGYTLVEAETVLVTHIQELCKNHISDFITRSETERLVESRKDGLQSLIEELIPTILSYSDIQRVLQSLVQEQVPINNLELILEVLVDQGRTVKEPEALTEKVREKLGNIICKNLKDNNGSLNVLTLAPDLERRLMSSQANTESNSIGLNPSELEKFVSNLAKETERMITANLQPVLLCGGPIRAMLRNLLIRTCPQLHVLSTLEVSKQSNIVSAGLIDVENKNSGGIYAR